MASSLSWPRVVVNTRSSAVNGVPSCQVVPWRIFQVVSMRPSGDTRHSPFSMLGTASLILLPPCHSCERSEEESATGYGFLTLRVRNDIYTDLRRGASVVIITHAH